jgi:hypothetical protein
MVVTHRQVTITTQFGQSVARPGDVGDSTLESVKPVATSRVYWPASPLMTCPGTCHALPTELFLCVSYDLCFRCAGLGYVAGRPLGKKVHSSGATLHWSGIFLTACRRRIVRIICNVPGERLFGCDFGSVMKGHVTQYCRHSNSVRLCYAFHRAHRARVRSS